MDEEDSSSNRNSTHVARDISGSLSTRSSTEPTLYEMLTLINDRLTNSLEPWSSAVTWLNRINHLMDYRDNEMGMTYGLLVQ